MIRTQVDHLKAEQLRDLQNDVAEVREKASSFLSRVEGEMRLLSHTSEIQQLADGLQRDGTALQPIVHAAAQELLALLRDTSSYVRVILLDAKGQEVTTLMFVRGKLQAVPTDQLATRPYYFYVHATADMKPGQIKFSPCEFRHPETDRIIPAIDGLLPLFSPQNSLTMILVVSVDAAKFFQLFDVRRYPSGTITVANAEGQYLYHSQKKKDWNALLAHQEDENLFHDYPPAMVRHILSDLPGTITEDPSRVVAYAPLFSGGDGSGSRHFLIADVPTATVFEAIRPLQTTFILGLVGIGALSALCGHWMARRFLHPIKQLIAGTTILREGNLNYTLDLKTRDEIQDLVDSFNDMVAHWREKRALEDKMRQFISDASHELRTPLAVLRGEVELGLKTPPNSNR
ncbi:MAG: HAMP domain-containing protein, partial [Chloroflexi bacterium]|nr:HAMP domain-containing protein [Chloroflexota bacterium]